MESLSSEKIKHKADNNDNVNESCSIKLTQFIKSYWIEKDRDNEPVVSRYVG